MAFIEQRGINRRRRRIDETLAVEHAEQTFLLGGGEGQRRARPRRYRVSCEDTTPPCSIAIHVPGVECERSAGGFHADVGRQIVDGEHHSSPLVSSAVGRPSATHSFFWASMISSARSSLWRRRAMSRFRCLI